MRLISSAVCTIISMALLLLFLAGCKPHPPKVQGYVEGYFRYLSSNSAGFLQNLTVERGTPVQAGQMLFVLDSQPEALQVQQSEQKLQQAQYDLTNLEKGQRETILQGIQAQINQANADLAYAEKTFLRYKDLVAKGAISRANFDLAQSDYARTKAQLQQYIANLNEAKLGSRTDVINSAAAAVNAADAEKKIASWYLAKKAITAPATGTVFDTYYRNGEFVAAGKPVVSLLIPEDMRIIFYVPEPLLSTISLGDVVSLSCDGCNKQFKATISFISSQAEFTPPIIFSEKERRKFVFRAEARLTPEEAKQLHPGQPIDVYLPQK